MRHDARARHAGSSVILPRRMSRPSHWILGFLVVAGGLLWWSGVLHEYLVARPAERKPRGETEPRSAVVRHATSAPKPIASEVAGVVVDRRGWPVVCAKVRLIDGDELVETDAFGRFRLRGPGAVNRVLRIEAPGRHAPLVARGGVEELALVLQDALPWNPEAATARVAPAPPADDLLVGEGWVRTASGEPAPGAKIVVRETGAAARTDEQGRYLLSLPDVPCTIVAWDHNGGVAVSESAAPPRRQGKLPLPELRLAPGHTVRGRLRDADGQSVVDAAIVVDNVGVMRTVHSEQGGLFVVSSLVGGELTVTVLPHRGHLGRRIRAVVGGDADLGDVAVAHAEREPLRVTVVDSAGAAKPFTHVVADQDEGLCRAYGQSDARGVVMFSGLGAGETRFEVRDAELRPMQIAGFDAAARTLSVSP